MIEFDITHVPVDLAEGPAPFEGECVFCHCLLYCYSRQPPDVWICNGCGENGWRFS